MNHVTSADSVYDRWSSVAVVHTHCMTKWEFYRIRDAVPHVVVEWNAPSRLLNCEEKESDREREKKYCKSSEKCWWARPAQTHTHTSPCGNWWVYILFYCKTSRVVLVLALCLRRLYTSTSFPYCITPILCRSVVCCDAPNCCCYSETVDYFARPYDTPRHTFRIVYKI